MLAIKVNINGVASFNDWADPECINIVEYNYNSDLSLLYSKVH